MRCGRRWGRWSGREEPRRGDARREPRHPREARPRAVRALHPARARVQGQALRARPGPRGELLPDEPRGGVLRGPPPRPRDGRRACSQPGRVDALLLRDPRRARGVRPPGRGGPHLLRGRPRGMAAPVRHPRPVRRQGAGEGLRRLPRGAGDPQGGASGVSGTRADRLVELLVERELDALLVTNLVNVRYLTGFTGTNGLCIVGPEIRLFLTDFRYVERAETEVRDFDRARGKQDLIGDAAEHLSRGAGDARRVGFEDDHLTVRRHQQLAKAVSDVVELIAAGGLAERLRAVKEPGELAAIRDAAALTDQVLKRLAERPLAGRTEREVALELEGEIRAQGAE